ncbi:MAG: type II secretion system protein [Kiritimatiellae bacterium]|nr:type II secretion system protein [Kiritimatiellia bacterium]
MRKAFTLVELLVVVGIMGLLGTVSVGGYRAMQRGMADRGVMENVNSFVRAAYQRAQIDRQPTVIYFWNETIRESTDTDNEIVVGKAVAVRRYGRISQVQGQYLYDEFADLQLTYQTDDEENSSSDENTMYLYPVDNLSDLESSSALRRSVVSGKVFKKEMTPLYLSTENGVMEGNSGDGKIVTYAFMLENAGGVTWEPGMAYGFEFARIELPHNYIFGSAYSTTSKDPVREAGTLVFDVGYNSGSGAQGGTGSRTSVSVSNLRPGQSGSLSAFTVGQSDNPTQDL